MNRLDLYVTHLQDNAYVRVERRGVVGLIHMQHTAPPRSQVGGCVMCGPMRAQILRALQELQKDPGCLVIVLASTSHHFFSSGIDISNFADCLLSDPTAQPPVPSLSELTAAVEACPKVCVAAVKGLCASWGLELALAADYRVCEVNAQWRFPEVRFGITPSGGGARRLVCRVGVPCALHMLCYGRPVYAKEAFQMGLIDVPACGAPHLWNALTEFIHGHVAVPVTETDGGVSKRKVGLCTMEDALAAKMLARQRRRNCPVYASLPFFNRGWYAWMEHKLRDSVPWGLQAPYRALEAVRIAVKHSSCPRRAARLTAESNAGAMAEEAEAAAYVEAERKLFESCLQLPEAKASQHLLRASQRTSRSWEKISTWRPQSELKERAEAAAVNNQSGVVAATPTVGNGRNSRTSSAPAPTSSSSGIRKVAVIGASIMGTSIALMLLSQAEMEEVILVETDSSRQATARRAIEDHLRRRVSTHRLSEHRCDAMLRHLRIVGNPITPFPPALADVDLVFECAREVTAVKQNIFAHLDGVCKRSTILATVSSAQEVSELASVTKRPGHVIGVHFFPPANESPLVEVIVGAATERGVVECVMRLLRHLDKYPVVSLSRQGYVGTRLLVAALYQAYAMLEEGCFPHQIDSALRKGFHATRGIFELEDIVGIDVVARARASMTAAASSDAGSGSLAPAASPKRRDVEATMPSAQERSNNWWLPRRHVFDIPESLIAAGTLGRKTRQGWYRYVTMPETTIRYSLQRSMASWLPQTDSVISRGRASEAVATTPKCTATVARSTSLVAPASATARAPNVARAQHLLLSLSTLLPQHNSSVESLILEVRRRRHTTYRPFRDEEIIERIFFVMINEAAKLMADGVIANSADIDCISVYMFGFPVWKGGLCYYADQVAGVDTVIYKMQVYQRALTSEVFPAPCTALLDMQARRLTFSMISK